MNVKNGDMRMIAAAAVVSRPLDRDMTTEVGDIDHGINSASRERI